MCLPDISITLLPTEHLKPHERTLPRRVKEVYHEISSTGGVHAIVASESGVVLDGHHRLRCLKQMGVACAPVVVVHYSSKKILVLPRRAVAVSKREVELRGLTGRPYPPKTTRHVFEFRLPSRRTSLRRLSAATGKVLQKED
jgi:hypothetical protein